MGGQATLCWRWVGRCRSPFFEQIMRQFCAESCGFCSGARPAPSRPLLSSSPLLPSASHFSLAAFAASQRAAAPAPAYNRYAHFNAQSHQPSGHNQKQSYLNFG